MFRVRDVTATPQQEEHIWVKHRVTLEEVEEVCSSHPLFIRGRDKSYAVYGQTESGRYLLVVLFPKGQGVYSLATAREMTEVERRYYRSGKR